MNRLLCSVIARSIATKQSKGLVFVVSAPSGCGKTSLIKALRKKEANLAHPVSFTTRCPRPGEKNDIDYRFISEGEFKKRLKRRDFLEWSKPFGKYYATSKQEIVKNMNNGKDVILSLDVKGAIFFKKSFKDTVLVYILPPSIKVLKERLLSRSAGRLKEISKRLSFARKDISNLKKYDYAIVNDDFKEAVEKLRSILVAERLRVR